MLQEALLVHFLASMHFPEPAATARSALVEALQRLAVPQYGCPRHRFRPVVERLRARAAARAEALGVALGIESPPLTW